MIPVLWLKAHPLCWDQDMIDRLLSGRLWRTRHTFEHHVDTLPGGTDGAVVVAPARYYTLQELQAVIDPLRWVLLILTSDEESTFPVDQLRHRDMRLWVMTPRAGVHRDGFYVGEGWSPDTPETVEGLEDRPLSWMFAGQVSHERRRECVKTLRRMGDGFLQETPGFTQGMEREKYLRHLAAAKAAPAPSGPATPDSFRCYEALEAGCVPVVDDPCPRYQTPGYWQLVYGEVPFPVLSDWADFPQVLDGILEQWPRPALECRSWWQQQKRVMANRLDADLDSLGVPANTPTPDDLVTVIVTSSPIPSHPNTSVIEQTVASVRERLPNADVIVACDGVRDEQAHIAERYDDYLLRVTRLCNTWRAIPVVLPEHGHQANVTRAALELVRTPLVLFMEHDTPLLGEIDLEGICAAVLTGEANLVRLHHEARVLKVHQHLMLDARPKQVAGVPMLRTAQWSQRPHIAGTDFYRDLIGTYFGNASRTMIEDVMHGVVDQAYRERGKRGWERWRLWMYAPEGDMKRSTHLDGRGDEPKFDDRFVFAYNGDTPEGAPRATAERCD